MPVNALTTEIGLRVGPVVLDTLIKHYFSRHSKARSKEERKTTLLRQDELLYDEVFSVIKEFLQIASHHTVEDVQGFANTRIPSPPWVRVVRVIVPMSSCGDAAKYLTRAFGGEDAARRVVGGVKWWQVRGINGVDAQWITAKKDWREARRRYKMQEKSTSSDPMVPSDSKPFDSGKYEEEMDEMRCILYSHGGGYYFGSVDQERYSIQRHARKINGRVFAVNYRLAPQYPFPCALQDLLAAYLFLITPPPGSAHRPVNPMHIVVAGDSAGGGLALALLQVIRDSGLPMPAGGVLISPWCDLTHSFPSIHTNTATDIIPAWGLSFQKPSVLWPPPSDDVSNGVRASLRSRIRQTFRMEEPDNLTATMLAECQASSAMGQAIDVGPTTPLPVSRPWHNQTVSLVARSGEVLSTDQQLHLYAQNSLIPHPLISPVLSYLGGLPPLLIIASDKEVLRDEIIYMAHKAAHPDKYPVTDEARALYPSLDGIESRHLQPTKVHLQVYDDTAHVLPVLFSFTNPAKFCFRAIATFCKHVTGLPQSPLSPITPSSPNIASRKSFQGFYPRTKIQTSSDPLANSAIIPTTPDELGTVSLPQKSLKRSLSESISRATSIMRNRGRMSRARTVHATEVFNSDVPSVSNSELASSGVGGTPYRSNSSTSIEVEELTAGNPSVYRELSGQPWDGTMIRERVSIQGITRPLEPESGLGSLDVQSENIGRLSELTMRRYLDARAMFDKKFSHTIHTIEKERRHNLKLAKKDIQKNMTVLQQYLLREVRDNEGAPNGIQEGLLGLSGTWGWILDGGESPPPSSIVSRRDTSEARRLAKLADQAVLKGDQTLSGNRFWSAIVNFLTATPDSDRKSPGIVRSGKRKTNN